MLKPFKIYINLVDKNRKNIFRLVIGTVANVLLEIGTPIIFATLINILINKETIDIHNEKLYLIIFFILLKLLITDYVIKVKYNFAMTYGYGMVKKSQHLFIKAPPLQRAHALTDDYSRIVHSESNNVVWKYFVPINDLFQEIIVIIGIVLVILYLDWILFITLSIIFCVFLITYKYIIRNNVTNSESIYREALSRTSEIIQSGYNSTLNHMNSDWIAEKINYIYENIVKIQINTILKSMRPRYYIEIIIIMLLLFSTMNNKNYDFKEANIIILTLVIRLLLSLSKISGLIHGIREGQKIANHSLSVCEPIYNISYKKINKRNFQIRSSNLIIDAENLVIGNDAFIKIIPNFSIYSNSKILISGESGSGKTTLLNIIAGSKEPKSGYINYYGFDENNFYKEIAYIPQKSHIIPGGLIENILLNYPQEGLIKSILNNMINLGFNSKKCDQLIKLSEIHNKLSGGEAQRISLLRLFYLNGIKLIILDEPTSALDLKNCIRVIEYLSMLNLPIIIVSHDANLISNISWTDEISLND